MLPYYSKTSTFKDRECDQLILLYDPIETSEEINDLNSPQRRCKQIQILQNTLRPLKGERKWAKSEFIWCVINCLCLNHNEDTRLITHHQYQQLWE